MKGYTLNVGIFIFILTFISISLSFADDFCNLNPATCSDPSSDYCSLNPASCAQYIPGGTGTGGTGANLNPGAASAKIKEALFDLCALIKNVLGVGMMFMVVASALVYSLGQTMGAETRARASVWATSMFNGAIIAALIYLLVPFVLRTMLSGTGVDSSINCFILF